MLIAFMAMTEQAATAKVDDLQVQLTEVQDQENALSSYATAIADGNITQDTYATIDPSVFNQLQQYQQNSNSIYNAQYQNAQSYATSSAGGLTGTSASIWSQQMANAAKQTYTNACKQVIAQQEKALDKKRIALETQMKLAEDQQKSAKEAKEKGIENNAAKLC